jgi:hypothetical protein
MSMRVQIMSSHPDKPLSGNYADSEVGAILELAVQRLVTAEEAVRIASRQLDEVLESARRNGQTRQAIAALKSLADRRSA